jgi:CubicO group peptidase (beta-lactamase class C family)
MTYELESIHSRLLAAVATAQAKSRVPSISAGIVLGEELAWTASVGYADWDSGRSADADTLYRIASITKTLTATAILQLRDEGCLSLGDPLVAHVPEFAAASNRFGPIEQVTLHGLLTHASGLQSDPPLAHPAPLEWGYLTRREILGSLEAMAVVIPPGSRFKYSNLGYELLGEVVRRVSGRSLNAYFLEYITGPLGMSSTAHDPDPELAARCAVGYRPVYLDQPAAAPPLPYGWCRACGGLWSTVSDLSRWISQQFRSGFDHRRGPGQVLDGPTLAEMHRPVVVQKDTLEGAQGLGWGIWRTGDLVMQEHRGGLDGFISVVEFDEVRQLGVIVLTNGTAETFPLADELAAMAAPIAATVAATRAAADVRRPAPAPVSAAWQPLIGSYRQGESEVRVEVRGEDLALVHVDSPIAPIGLTTTDDPDRFVVTAGRFIGEDLRFTRDGAGRVLRLVEGSEPYIRVEPLAQ